MQILDDLKKIYLADDVDSETYQENLAEISKWEEEIVANENMASWKEHDVTRRIITQARESYKSLCMRLAQDRKLTEADRISIYAKQDACLWIISLASKDTKQALKSLEADIKLAISQV